MNAKFPRQKKTRTEKDLQWKKDCVDGIVEMSNFSGPFSDQYDLKRKAYNYYNGIIEDEDYTHVLKPYGKKRGNLPAKLHNYQIIKPVIDLLLGEMERRPLTYSVVVSNEDVITLKEQEKKARITKALQAQFTAELARLGLLEGDAEAQAEQEGESPLPEDVAEMFEREYTDWRAIIGQEAVNYLRYDLKLEEQRAKAWKDFLICGECYSLRNAVSSEVEYEILNPLELDYDKSPGVDFVEDGDWAISRKWVTQSDAIDAYYDELTSAQIDQIEDDVHQFSSAQLFVNDLSEDSKRDHKGRLIELVRVWWKSRKKIGFVSYFDEYGELQEKEVDEDYDVDKESGETVEWFWINEVWEGTRLDNSIYMRMQPVEMQHRHMDNPSKCKLPVNGRAYSDRNSQNISLVMMGIPYQLTYNIYKYRLETSIAKSKDVIGAFDINMIPKGWSMDKWMYFLDAVGIAWVDYSKEDVNPSSTHQTLLDLSVKTIEQHIALLEQVWSEWERVSGVTRQRQGQVSAYDGKAATEMGIVQSSHITEDYFSKFAHFEERDLQALMEISKTAWRGGKKGMYVLPNGSQQFFELDGLDHAESEYGIFVSNSREDQRKLEELKSLTQAMAQNGATIKTLVDIVGSDNYSQIQDAIKSAEDARRKLEEAQAQAAQQEAQQEAQMEQMKLEHEAQQNELDRQKDLEVAQIQANTKLSSEEMKELANRRKQREDEVNKNEEQRLKRDQFNQSKKEHNDEMEIKRKQLAQKNSEKKD